ncbi:Palmitoyltransferase [Ophidiomyces ophidiicola]|nr:Palmitoyltransferase [Ophidiomyces ophidiicola]
MPSTTIEGWEIERHRTLLRRARVFGGYLDGPEGTKVRIQKQEFPFDIGIWQNISASMGGGSNFLGWFWPFSRSPPRDTGLDFEVNGFEDPSLPWPPLDPDRMYRPVLSDIDTPGTILDMRRDFDQDAIDAFRRRQELDYRRHKQRSTIHRRKPFHERYMHNIETEIMSDASESITGSSLSEGEESWRNAEGERLRDFGVDEEAEFYDEDDIPLAVLIQRRKKMENLKSVN